MFHRRMKTTFFILYITFFSFISSNLYTAAQDTITSTQSLRDNNTLVSSGETFQLGFFTGSNSTNGYLGIWFKKISIHTVVWVANRDNPLNRSTAALKIDGGNLILVDDSATVYWSTNLSNTSSSAKPVAQLLDSGNLVLRQEGDQNSGNFLWQSFDHPSDTLLPGMKLGWNLKTGLNRFLTARKNDDDPSSGDYTFKIDPNGSAQLFLARGSYLQYRSGPWNGIRFSGVPEMNPSEIFSFEFVENSDEVYYTFELRNSSVFSRVVLNASGQLQRYAWAEEGAGGGIWSLFWWAPKDQCDYYSQCGAYGVCDVDNSPVCACARGFEPKSPDDWSLRVTDGGCVRKEKLDCRGDGFLKLLDMKLPDTQRAAVNRSMSTEECRLECLKSCSCVAYANADIREGGSGCIRWSSDLVDLREYSDGGQDLYLRVPASELDIEGGTKKRKRVIVIATVTPALVLLLVLGVAVFCIWKKRNNAMRMISMRTGSNERSQDFPLTDLLSMSSGKDIYDENRKEDFDLPFYDLKTIAAATDNFSDENKLGRGGFGPVYMGKLEDGQEIAVKRLSNNSGQGLNEFKNEVVLIAKLQHRNLVRLLGCCIEREERMLVYEYMQNRSLDSIIFDETKKHKLDWKRRFDIIMGIARGLLYLHQDSRFRIIHRDLKASNILIDGQMNPKISDFGMARIFGGDQMEANTKRVVGTFGYMSPEYAMDGVISVKSDVFSFGVILLEIVTGKKNRGYYEKNQQLNLLGHVWQLWKEESAIELLDSSMEISSIPMSEVLRCMQVGLLCVQERAEERPTMSNVVLMLSSESARLPQPKQPGFCTGRSALETDSSSSKQETCTINQVTVTMLESR